MSVFMTSQRCHNTSVSLDGHNMLSSSVFPSSSFVIRSTSPPQNHRLPVLSPDSPSACLSASVLPNCTVAWHQPIISIKISTREESCAPGVKVFSRTAWLEAHFVVSSKRGGFQDPDPRAVNHPQRWTRGPLWCGGGARFACSWRHFRRDFFFFPMFCTNLNLCAKHFWRLLFSCFLVLVCRPTCFLVRWCTLALMSRQVTLLFFIRWLFSLNTCASLGNLIEYALILRRCLYEERTAWVLCVRRASQRVHRQVRNVALVQAFTCFCMSWQAARFPLTKVLRLACTLQ